MTSHNDLKNWKLNAEENYTTTPISVLKYITVLEELLLKSELAVIEGKIEILREFLPRQNERFKMLEIQRNELLNRLNITENECSSVAEVKEKSFVCLWEGKESCTYQCAYCKQANK